MSLAFALALLSACAQDPLAATPGACVPLAPDWRVAATDDDRRRIRSWRDAWTEALGQARESNQAAAVAAEAILLDPDAALPAPAPPPGSYDCRTFKLGAGSAELAFVSYPAFTCRIEARDGKLLFVKVDGSQRPIGRLFADTERRMVFLGTLQLGDESRSYEYGVDRERDMVGLLERISENRWRLVFPYPHFESLLDVIELTPR